MNKIVKAVATGIAAASVLGMVFTGAACKKENVIVVGYTDYEPMNYKDENGELIGFDTELAKETFSRLGYTVRFKEINWSNKYIELDGGTIDCIWNGFTWNCTDEDGANRNDKIDFSIPYMQNAQCVVRGANEAELTSAAQFDGKSVAYEVGSAGETYVTSVKEITVNKKDVTSQMEAVREVNMGTAQYAVVDVLLAEKLAGKGDFTNLVINRSIEITKEEYAVGFKKNSELTKKVNDTLEILAQDGFLTKLAEKYNLSNSLLLTNAK